MTDNYVVDEARLQAIEANGGGWVAKDNSHYLLLAEHGYVATDGEVDADGDVFYQLTDLGKAWLSASRQSVSPVAPPKPPKPPRAPKLVHPAPVESQAAVTPLPVGDEWAHVSPTVDIVEEEWNRPARRRGFARKESAKPTLRDVMRLDELPIGGSRHIAPTEAIPEPWKSYGSTVAAENKRHAKPRLDVDGRPMTVFRKVRGKDTRAAYPVFDYSKRFVIFQAHPNDPKGPGARILRVEVNSEEE